MQKCFKIYTTGTLYLNQRLLNTKVFGLSVGEEVVQYMKGARSRIEHSSSNAYLQKKKLKGQKQSAVLTSPC